MGPPFHSSHSLPQERYSCRERQKQWKRYTEASSELLQECGRETGEDHSQRGKPNLGVGWERIDHRCDGIVRLSGVPVSVSLCIFLGAIECLRFSIYVPLTVSTAICVARPFTQLHAPCILELLLRCSWRGEFELECAFHGMAQIR